MTKLLDESRYDQLISIRRYLHKHPEISGEEYHTAEYIQQTLHQLNPPQELLTELGGTGIAAVYEAEQSGPTLLFRAELDALPIIETNDMPYKSDHRGISHKCGHDGHMTVLLGLALWLKDNPPEKGRVVLLFQPSEENGAGAVDVLADPAFAKIRPDCVYAFHNLPGYPMGQIICKEGPFTSAVNSIIFKLEGKTSHAAEPGRGRNPALAIARTLTQVNEWNQPDRSRTDFRIFTPIYAALGEKAYGTSAGYGELHYTLRTRNEDVMEESEEQLKALVQQLAKQDGLSVEIDHTDRFYGNSNDQSAVNTIVDVAKAKDYETLMVEDPLSFGEDFGAFTQKFTGAMFCIGAGDDTPALHNPDYDFPDELIHIGVNMFAGIITRHLQG
ncbi:MAG TPA: amidohydrolase [Saprospiraceae bacterium]|nr:amidohydrolase [Saprospiraceae bacterium]